MSYNLQPVFATATLTPLNELVAKSSQQVPTTQPPLSPQQQLTSQMIAGADSVQNSQPAVISLNQPVNAFLRPRYAQLPTDSVNLYPQTHPILPTSNLVFNTPNEDLFSVSLPKPINYSNLNQVTKVEPVIVANSRPFVSNRITPVNQTTQLDPDIKNNINIQVENKQLPHRGHKRNICLGVVIGILIMLIIIIVGVITLMILRKKIPFLNDLSTSTKSTRLKAACDNGYFGADCSQKCNLTNAVPLVVSINFRYKKNQLINNNMIVTTERRLFYGLMLDDQSVLVAKHNLITNFTYIYNNIQYSVKVEPNNYNPTYESMYTVIINPFDAFKIHFHTIPNVASIHQMDSVDLAVLKLQNPFKITYSSDFNLNCLIYYESAMPSDLGISASTLYANIEWIGQQL